MPSVTFLLERASTVRTCAIHCNSRMFERPVIEGAYNHSESQSLIAYPVRLHPPTNRFIHENVWPEVCGHLTRSVHTRACYTALKGHKQLVNFSQVNIILTWKCWHCINKYKQHLSGTYCRWADVAFTCGSEALRSAFCPALIICFCIFIATWTIFSHQIILAYTCRIEMPHWWLARVKYYGAPEGTWGKK